jgi:hypothetical protein
MIELQHHVALQCVEFTLLACYTVQQPYCIVTKSGCLIRIIKTDNATEHEIFTNRQNTDEAEKRKHKNTHCVLFTGKPTGRRLFS